MPTAAACAHAEALPLFVPQLRARGYEFVTVGELLAAGTPEIAPTCYERRPGDNARYDVVAKLRKEHQPPPVFPTTVRKPAAAPVPLPWTSHIEGSP